MCWLDVKPAGQGLLEPQWFRKALVVFGCRSCVRVSTKTSNGNGEPNDDQHNIANIVECSLRPQNVSWRFTLLVEMMSGSQWFFMVFLMPIYVLYSYILMYAYIYILLFWYVICITFTCEEYYLHLRFPVHQDLTETSINIESIVKGLLRYFL